MADASIPNASDSCKTCRFWRFDTTRPGFTTLDNVVVPDLALGICRRRAPVPFENSESYGTLWPSVSEADWCGEHEARG